MSALSPILGLVLAGGKSTRMGVDKAFVTLGGRPLVAYAIERLRAQVDALALSANEAPERFAAFSLPVLADADSDRELGPLAGVAAGLNYAQRQGWALVVTAPCDAPFAPLDFVARLASSLESGASAALAESPRGLEPLFALWRADLSVSLRAYLAQGKRSPRDFLSAHGAARVRFATADAFANLNSPAELERARASLAGLSP